MEGGENSGGHNNNFGKPCPTPSHDRNHSLLIASSINSPLDSPFAQRIPPSFLPSWQKPETSFIPRNKLIYEFLLELFFLIFYHPFSFRLKNSSQFWKYLRLLRLENFDSNDDLATKVFEFLRIFFASIFQSRKQILTAEDRLTRRTT